MSDYIPCFACGAQSLNIEGECHKYMLSSPGCWVMFCEIMEKEYSDFRYSRAHQFTVDAYSCQHIGEKEDNRAVNSVNIHLSSLYLLFEEGISISEAPKIRDQFSQFYKGKNLLEWLVPPKSLGELTIYNLWDNENPDLHFEIAEKWARSVWECWSHQHHIIAHLVNQIRK